MKAQSEQDRSSKARVVLERLGEGGVLRPVENGRFRLYTKKANRFIPVLDVDGQTVDALLRRELLDPVERPIDECARRGRSDSVPHRDRRSECSTFKLSAIGRMHLRRRHARGGTGFAVQHRHMNKIYIPSSDKANKSYSVNIGESPLGWLKTRKDGDGRPMISDCQYSAGEILRSDYTLGHLTPSITTNWQSYRIGAGPGQGVCEAGFALSDAALQARDRVYDALSFVGDGLAEILLQTCCYLNGIEQAERNLGWPRRSGKIVLQIALDRLALHYRLSGRRD